MIGQSKPNIVFLFWAASGCYFSRFFGLEQVSSPRFKWREHAPAGLRERGGLRRGWRWVDILAAVIVNWGKGRIRRWFG